ncbi:hypothetical protein [Cellulomonas fengjieae]|uniref:Knr4/Smi1-like domain-containing protein n=1 Tax=Cellulomonas fengjieae TaxID=2819978 RepID=A0ABS3SHB2_9CELL|nr:hypothetical protein [Cellulomonas fengjieae]MBO3085140.1 hypothetical protein [Cellulomonas fengjieae]QVI66283.1 hypothetical protein KG102_01270 [Cellulomonas fengjieae]
MDLEGVLADLDAAGVWLDPALTAEEIADVERRFGFTFCADHRALLELAVPVGDHWPDWLSDDEEPLRQSLAWPVESVISDVLSGDFWPASWGDAPADRETAARENLAAVPRMVPVWGHRYLPAAPAPRGVPVFSVYGTDVIHYGSDLADYLAREFLGRSGPVPPATHGIPFWSDLVDGV